MEVTLKIEANQLGETVVDLFRNLNQDQKKEIAIDILTKWLKEPYHIEKEAYAESIVREFRESNLKLDWGRKGAADCTDKEIKESTEYRSRLSGFKSTREIMIKEITTEVITYFKEKIPEQIKADPKIEALRDAMYQFIVDNFPMMIKESFTRFFTDHLSSIVCSASSAMSTSTWFENALQTMKQDLKNKYNVDIN